MTKFADVRGCLVRRSDCVSVLLFKQRPLLYESLLFEPYLAINYSSTSHSPSRKTSALRVIVLPINGSLVWVCKEEKKTLDSRSVEGPGEKSCAQRCPGFGFLQVALRGKNFLLYELLLFKKKEYFHSTNHYSSKKEIPALRITSCSTSYSSSFTQR